MKIFTNNFLHVFLLINTFACDAKMSENDLLIEHIKKKQTNLPHAPAIYLLVSCSLGVALSQYLFINIYLLLT